MGGALWRLVVLAIVVASCSETSSESSDGATTTTTSVTTTTSTTVAPVDPDPIVIPIHNWPSQEVGAQIVGRILEQTGATVEYRAYDSSQPVYDAMCTGEVSLVHEIWEGAFGYYFEPVLDRGCVVDVATHDARTQEGWWYPAYVEPLCPGLPDWEALRDCPGVFATDSDRERGRYLSGPVEWRHSDANMIEALGLPFAVEFSGTAMLHFDAIASAVAKQVPILAFNWTPNRTAVLYEGSFVEFPLREEACVKDPSWGVNPEMTWDCNPSEIDLYIKIGAWEGFEEKWPEEFAVLSAINFTTDDLGLMEKRIEVDGAAVEEVADEWLTANAERVDDWLAAT